MSLGMDGKPGVEEAIAPPYPTASLPVFRIEPSRGWVDLKLRELWEYRELLHFLAWRDVKVRYTQTLLGGAWAIIQPLLTMVVFSLIFGRLAKMPSDGLPYPIFSFAALVPWTFFCKRAEPRVEQSGGQRQSHQEGIFPPVGHANRRGARRTLRHTPGFCRTIGDDVLLWPGADGQRPLATHVVAVGLGRSARRRHVACRRERAIP